MLGDKFFGLNDGTHSPWARTIALAAMVAAGLAFPAGAAAQQQLPSRPISDVPAKKPILESMLDQITPRVPKGYDFQKTPVVPDRLKASPPQPQPTPCAAFKGSAEDMSALRKTAKEAAVRRAIAATGFDASIPKNCAGQEWAFYLLFLANVGEGRL